MSNLQWTNPHIQHSFTSWRVHHALNDCSGKSETRHMIPPQVRALNEPNHCELVPHCLPGTHLLPEVRYHQGHPDFKSTLPLRLPDDFALFTVPNNVAEIRHLLLIYDVHNHHLFLKFIKHLYIYNSVTTLISKADNFFVASRCEGPCFYANGTAMT